MDTKYFYDLQKSLKEQNIMFCYSGYVTESILSAIGETIKKKLAIEETELGIYDTAQLKSLLGVLGDKITLDTLKMGDRAISLKIKNEAVSVDFNLSDLSVIPEAPKMKHIPNFGTKIKIDSHFINNFVEF